MIIGERKTGKYQKINKGATKKLLRIMEGVRRLGHGPNQYTSRW